jgi:hypothetical protein
LETEDGSSSEKVPKTGTAKRPAKGWCYPRGWDEAIPFCQIQPQTKKSLENAARIRQGLGAFAERRICPSKKQTSMVKNHIFDH